MRLLVVNGRSPSETVTGAAHNQRALLAGLGRRGFEVSFTSGIRTTAAAIDAGRPDAIMVWGDRELASEVTGFARPRGIPTVHQIRTPSRYHVEQLAWDGTPAIGADERARLRALRVADLVLVPSSFMADYWAARLGVRPAVMHPVVLPERVLARRRGARFVTFVNPEPGKGLGLFWRLAAEAAVRLPRTRFLVVEGRWDGAAMARAGVVPPANVRVVPHQRDVRRIWARTSVLLVPSVLPEAFGMVVQEAQLNGIPVIASRLAGIPEAANGGGVLIPPPRRCVADWVRVPSAREIRPWLDALAALVADRGARDRARRRALEASRGFAPDRIIDGLAARLRELV